MAAFDKRKGKQGKWKARVQIDSRNVFLGYYPAYYPALIAEYEYLKDNCPNPEGCLHDYCHLRRSTGKTHREMVEELGA